MPSYNVKICKSISAAENASVDQAVNMLAQLILLATVSFDTSSGLHVKVGHIGALHVMPNGDRVLEIARQELVKEGLLHPNMTIE